MDMQSDLARVRGLGPAKEGTTHWWAQRLTAVALVPLGLWFAYAALGFGAMDLAGLKAWMNAPGNLLLMVLFVGVTFYHMQLGLQAVIEDYVHGEKTKVAMLVLNMMAAVFLAVSCIVAMLKIAFGV